jgi:hypothetical protein
MLAPQVKSMIKVSDSLETRQTCEPTVLTPLLSLGIQGVGELFPGFAEGDFAFITGSSASVVSLLCVRAQLPLKVGGLGSNVVCLDAGNLFRLYDIARLARLNGMDPHRVLGNIFISRAFTAYQLVALVMEKLDDAVTKFGAKLVIISDPLGLFLSDDLDDHEAQSVFSQTMTCIADFAKRNQSIIVATNPHRHSQRSYLQSLAQHNANVSLSFNKEKGVRVVSLHQHPSLPLGSVELPSESTTLTQFIQDQERIQPNDEHSANEHFRKPKLHVRTRQLELQINNM